MKWTRYVIYALCCSGLLSSCTNKNEANEDAEPVVSSVSVTSPVMHNFTDFIQLNGNTQFQKKLVVRANITGYITSMKWKTGDHIAGGTLFCTIKTKEQDALKNTDSNDPSLKQFQTPLKVYANASGLITGVNYSVGDFVNEGDVLATITDPSSLVLVVNVPYEYHSFVFRGRSCSVVFPDGKIMASKIQEEVPIVDAASQTQSYLIRFPGNQSMPENINLVVHIPVKQSHNAISLPLEAIQTNETQDEFWVMKMANDSIAVRVPVNVGLQADSLREIISGVSINDKIIKTGAYGLTDSSMVKLQTEKE
jgi:biotin carboxyl carrier protein